MPRQPRVDIPGTLYHVMVRGIERRKIFCDEKDYKVFLQRLSDLVIECRIECYAWAMMPNHFHLLIIPIASSLSTFMQRLLTGYAVNFNYRYKRSGHLFQNRYKAIICQKETYLLELVRYIHLNPLRAGLVANLEELDEYQFCGHAGLLGKIAMEWQNTDDILGRFGEMKNLARRKYREYVALGQKEGRKSIFQGGGLRRSAAGWEFVNGKRQDEKKWQSDERILGNDDFVMEILKQVGAKDQSLEKRKRQGWTLAKIAQVVCREYAIKEDVIKDRYRNSNGSKVRAIIAYLGKHELGCSIKQIAQFFNITQPGATKMIARGKAVIQQAPINDPGRS